MSTLKISADKRDTIIGMICRTIGCSSFGSRRLGWAWPHRYICTPIENREDRRGRTYG